MLTEFRVHEKKENRRLRRLAVKNGARKHKNIRFRPRGKLSAFEAWAREDARKNESMGSKMGSVRVRETGFFTKMVGGIQNMIGMHR